MLTLLFSDISTLWILYTLPCIFFFILLTGLIRNHFHAGLNKYPAPAFASLTNWWRFVVVARRKAHVTHLKLHQELGGIVRLGPNALSFSDPRAVREIYGLNNKVAKSEFYPVQMQVAKGEILQSLFGTTNQDYHAKLRRMVSNGFSMSNIAQYEARIDETARVFLDQTDKLFAAPGRVCDFKLWLQYFAFDVITEVTYSRRVGFIDRREDVDGIIAWVDKLVSYSAPVGQMPILDRLLVKNPILTFLSKHGLIDTSSGAARFSQARMAERLAEIESQKHTINDRADLLTMFLKTQRDDKSGFFHASRVLTMATSLAVAGSDTTAISLAAVFYHLLRNPARLHRLQSELTSATESGLICPRDRGVVSWAEAQNLPYLDACIKEAFRVHPAISLILERVTPSGGMMICGEMIPGGTIVGCNPWVIQRQPEIFGEDAEVYRPERWLIDVTADGERETSRLREMNANMLHFGAGSRTCLGKHIGILEIYKLVPSFLMRFDLELTRVEEWDLKNVWFVKPVEFDVRIKRREKQVL
ncbi:cytochrome P450 oxidoreductase [Podospora aff. communis PSN243]|uniref:Cytochrome P450 oxidoreductase n=1 Tax=Podospora aff. communis PSN243 TaxID=3040156 RepID=A0AAV9G6Z9_9PEZI|nr:cytochrome P450 oxidoreductase [Podospora aff. communis PSN243]